MRGSRGLTAIRHHPWLPTFVPGWQLLTAGSRLIVFVYEQELEDGGIGLLTLTLPPCAGILKRLRIGFCCQGAFGVWTIDVDGICGACGVVVGGAGAEL